MRVKLWCAKHLAYDTIAYIKAATVYKGNALCMQHYFSALSADELSNVESK